MLAKIITANESIRIAFEKNNKTENYTAKLSSLKFIISSKITEINGIVPLIVNNFCIITPTVIMLRE